MSEFEKPESAEPLPENGAPVTGSEFPPSEPAKSGGGKNVFFKAILGIVLVLGLTTVVIASTAPKLLSPLVDALPDSLFPKSGTNVDGSSGAGTC